jgi:hypothetical protein
VLHTLSDEGVISGLVLHTKVEDVPHVGPPLQQADLRGMRPGR